MVQARYDNPSRIRTVKRQEVQTVAPPPQHPTNNKQGQGSAAGLRHCF
jgi:hypothetical protein